MGEKLLADAKAVALVALLGGVGLGGAGGSAMSRSGPTDEDIKAIVESVVTEAVRREFDREKSSRAEINAVRETLNEQKFRGLEERVDALEKRLEK